LALASTSEAARVLLYQRLGEKMPATMLRDTIVLGASAGGIDALKRLLPVFPADLAAVVLIAVHLSPDPVNGLDRILGRSCALPVRFGTHGMALEPRSIILAPPDRHLLVVDDHVVLSSGPRENRSRPAIDPLFRSAALHRAGRVIAAVLSGHLDDGAAGLLAVKRCGGIALVQAPDDAECSSMPLRASEALDAHLDGSLPIEQLGRRIVHSVGTPLSAPGELPRDLVLEEKLLLQSGTDFDPAKQQGELVPMTCPECGGPLHMTNDGIRRYHCITGHVFTTSALLEEQGTRVENALWAAVRAMEERGNTLTTLARDSASINRARSNTRLTDEAASLRKHAQTLREILLGQRSANA
jgi:two-component system chemotaxis response regulator CheB